VPNRSLPTVVVCPKCRKPEAAILTPVTPEEITLLFKCIVCAFTWVTANPFVTESERPIADLD
jgi:hypothetical protein